MPTYCYRCPSCKTEVEREVPMSLRKEQVCATCLSLLVQIPAPFLFVLNGKGWAKDGYGSSGFNSGTKPEKGEKKCH